MRLRTSQPRAFAESSRQQRANALAAAGDQVLRDVGDDFDGRGRLLRELLLDGGEIVTEEVEDLGGGRDGKSAH